ncbi:hypothetical protein AB0O28_35025 [Microbispora sp. NPDC088329]|uniref:hypothetical protein n=1 Tax=Microbispora sp. NPDC088329 TaxID=3154869 RepID=UPI00341D61D3
MRHLPRIAATALALATAFVTVTPASAAADRPLSRTQLKKVLLTKKDLGKGWGVIDIPLRRIDLTGLDVNDAACVTAAREFDAAFETAGKSQWILGRISGAERVYTGSSSKIERMTSAARRVAAACDGAGDARNMVKITKRSPGDLGDAAYGFEVRDENPPYPGQGSQLVHFDYVVIRYRSVVALVQGAGGGRNRWKDTLELARKAAGKLASAYPRRA